MDQQELLQVWNEGTEEEREVLQLAIQAIRQKRERNSVYVSGFLGLKGSFVEEGVYEFRIPITPYMMNSLGIVHGGITATLADSTMGSLINQSLPKGKYAVTSEMKVNYVKPGVGKELISRAKLIHKGKSLVVAQCEITNERGNLVVFATGTFSVLG